MKTINPLAAICVAAALATFANWASADVGSAAGTACETQVVPTMPRSAVQGFEHESVKVKALVRDGVVRDVQIVKGPRLYASSIRAAMRKYQCRQQDSDFWVTQEFVFNATPN